MEYSKGQLSGDDVPAAEPGPRNVWVFASGKNDPMALPAAVADSLDPEREDLRLVWLAPLLSGGARSKRVRLLDAGSHDEALARLPELREHAQQVAAVLLGTWTLGLVFGRDQSFASRDAHVFSAASDLIAGVVGVLQAGPHQRWVENFVHNLDQFVRPCLAPTAPIVTCLVRRPTILRGKTHFAIPAIARTPGQEAERLPTVADLATYISRRLI